MSANIASSKQNCWEYFNCSREISNKNRINSVCNVSLISSQHGINGGINAGRHCWEIEGSYCAVSHAEQTGQDYTLRGTVTHKEEHCNQCSFRAMVQQEEGSAFVD